MVSHASVASLGKFLARNRRTPVPEQCQIGDIEREKSMITEIFALVGVVCTGLLALRAVNYLVKKADWRRMAKSRQETYRKTLPAEIARDPYKARGRIMEHIGYVVAFPSTHYFGRFDLPMLAGETRQLQALLADAEKAIRADRIVAAQ